MCIRDRDKYSDILRDKEERSTSVHVSPQPCRRYIGCLLYTSCRRQRQKQKVVRVSRHRDKIGHEVDAGKRISRGEGRRYSHIPWRTGCFQGEKDSLYIIFSLLCPSCRAFPESRCHNYPFCRSVPRATVPPPRRRGPHPPPPASPLQGNPTAPAARWRCVCARDPP